MARPKVRRVREWITCPNAPPVPLGESVIGKRLLNSSTVLSTSAAPVVRRVCRATPPRCPAPPHHPVNRFVLVSAGQVSTRLQIWAAGQPLIVDRQENSGGTDPRR